MTRSSARSSCGPACGSIRRRTFLADLGMGFTGLALGSMLASDGCLRAAESSTAATLPGGLHHAPRASRVIWVFCSGGYSHLETFDPKPALNRYAGLTYDTTDSENPQKSPLFLARSRSVVGFDREVYSKIMPLQVGFAPRGQSGIEMSDWWPHLAGQVDDICFVRSMYTTDNDHAAEFQMHHGRHALDEIQPTLGSWIHYGLGTLNENLPQFVFLGEFSDSRVKQNFGADYLGPQHAGVQLSLEPGKSLPFAQRGAGVLELEQEQQFAYIRQLGELAAVEYPDDEQLRARIKSYELAFRMQMSVPEALDLDRETAETQKLYGLDEEATAPAGRRLLAARRLAERGVRYTLVYASGYGTWDSHQDLKNLHAKRCSEVDRPIAGLLADLKRRGMWDDTLVVFCTEFGRTPAVQDGKLAPAATGRDHHPHGFTIWLAGGAVKGGYVHGATDELGFHAVEHPHYVTDLHATVLHALGLDSRRLEIPGRKRLDADHGRPIMDLFA
ncbi:MAG: DUF1501 domain-containing protein [Pirellulales bacterium]|nr:DUF1501 domain-containing protein [Pirellulales bacterium]